MQNETDRDWQLTCIFPIRKAKRSKPTMMIQIVKMISHI
jgi:hypothetical protein